MNVLQRDEVRTLAESHEGPCVSIYMPTHRAFPDTKQDPIRFKNILRDAADLLNGGVVYAMKPEDMPDQAHLCAQFRY